MTAASVQKQQNLLDTRRRPLVSAGCVVQRRYPAPTGRECRRARQFLQQSTSGAILTPCSIRKISHSHELIEGACQNPYPYDGESATSPPGVIAPPYDDIQVTLALGGDGGPGNVEAGPNHSPPMLSFLHCRRPQPPFIPVSSVQAVWVPVIQGSSKRGVPQDAWQQRIGRSVKSQGVWGTPRCGGACVVVFSLALDEREALVELAVDLVGSMGGGLDVGLGTLKRSRSQEGCRWRRLLGNCHWYGDGI